MVAGDGLRIRGTPGGKNVRSRHSAGFMDLSTPLGLLISKTQLAPTIN